MSTSEMIIFVVIMIGMIIATFSFAYNEGYKAGYKKGIIFLQKKEELKRRVKDGTDR